MRRLRVATLEAVEAINNGLKAANVDLKLEVKGTSTETIGDIRRNMIVMVEDPEDHSVIGYGPAVADPLTGEILSARVMMYYGVMKKYARFSWDEYVEDQNKSHVEIQATVPVGRDRMAIFSAAASSAADVLDGVDDLPLRSSRR